MTEPSSDNQITELLQAWRNGDSEHGDEFLRLVYGELKKQARRYLRRERQDHTLQTTALVNEAFMRLNDQRSIEWQNREQFFAIAASMMRRILVDHARTKAYQKRGGNPLRVSLAEVDIGRSPEATVDLLALDQALERLAKLDQRQTKIVELRFFAGLSVEETAIALDISPATVKREWSAAKAYLHRLMSA